MPGTDFAAPRDLKKAGRNIADAYDYPLDCLAEPIQNAFKSIELRIEEEPDHKGEITIRLNTSQKRITIIDNGKGFVDFDKSLKPSTSGWADSGGKETPEAGFGNGLTSLIMLSNYAEIDSVTTDGKTRRITFKDSYFSFYGNKKQQAKGWTPVSPAEVKNSSKSAKIKTKVVLGGKEKAYKKLWNMLDDEWIKLEQDEGVSPFVMLEGALLWHTALGWTRTLWGFIAPNIKYKLELTSAKMNGGKKQQTPFKKIGHPLTNLPSRRGIFNVLQTKPKNKPMPKPKSDDILVAKKVCKAAVTDSDAEGVQLRIYAVTLVGDDDDTVTDKMKQDFDKFPMYHYPGERYFISLNGYNQAAKQNKPSVKGLTGNLAIHNNSLFVYDIDVNSSKKKLEEVLESGRNRFKQTITEYINPLIHRNAVQKLDTFQKGAKKVDYLNDVNIIDNARKLYEDLPWDKTSQNPSGFETNLGFANLHRKPSDENWVASVFGSLLGRNLVNEIRIIIVGHNNDTYDLVFWNDLPADLIPKGTLKNLQISKPLKGKKHSDSNIPLFGEVKMNTRDFCLDIDGEKTRKDPSKIKFLVCWEASINHPEDWTLNRCKIGTGLVRCSTHRLTKSIGGKSTIKMDVLVMSDYLKYYDKASKQHEDDTKKYKKSPKKNGDPGDFVWPPVTPLTQWW